MAISGAPIPYSIKIKFIRRLHTAYQKNLSLATFSRFFGSLNFPLPFHNGSSRCSSYTDAGSSQIRWGGRWIQSTDPTG